MAIDKLLHIGGEIVVHDRCGVLGEEREAFGDGAAGRGRWLDDCDRMISALDDDFGAGPDSGQYAGEVADCFRLRDVKCRHAFDDSSNLVLDRHNSTYISPWSSSLWVRMALRMGAA